MTRADSLGRVGPPLQCNADTYYFFFPPCWCAQLLETFKQLLARKREQLMQAKQRLESGVDKITLVRAALATTAAQAAPAWFCKAQVVPRRLRTIHFAILSNSVGMLVVPAGVSRS